MSDSGSSSSYYEDEPDDEPPASESKSDDKKDKKGKKGKKDKKGKKGKKGKNKKDDKATCIQKFRTELITGSVNCVLLLSAGSIFTTGVLIGLLPRLRKTQEQSDLDVLPKLSPVLFAGVVLLALFAMMTSIFGLLGVCCTKNAPNCSRCCMCINVSMGLIGTALISGIAVMAVFLTVSTQMPGCPFGNFTDDDLQPDINKCPYDSVIWLVMQPSGTVYSNWNSIQDALSCCGYYCGYFVTEVNGTSTPVCMDDPSTKWQRTGGMCASKPMKSPPCREEIVQFFDEKMVYISLVACYFALLLVLLVGTSSVMRCSTQLDKDRPTLRLELPSARELMPREGGGKAGGSDGGGGGGGDSTGEETTSSGEDDSYED